MAIQTGIAPWYERAGMIQCTETQTTGAVATYFAFPFSFPIGNLTGHSVNGAFYYDGEFRFCPIGVHTGGVGDGAISWYSLNIGRPVMLTNSMETERVYWKQDNDTLFRVLIEKGRLGKIYKCEIVFFANGNIQIHSSFGKTITFTYNFTEETIFSETLNGTSFVFVRSSASMSYDVNADSYWINDSVYTMPSVGSTILDTIQVGSKSGGIPDLISVYSESGISSGNKRLRIQTPKGKGVIPYAEPSNGQPPIRGVFGVDNTVSQLQRYNSTTVGQTEKTLFSGYAGDGLSGFSLPEIFFVFAPARTPNISSYYWNHPQAIKFEYNITNVVQLDALCWCNENLDDPSHTQPISSSNWRMYYFADYANETPSTSQFLGGINITSPPSPYKEIPVWATMTFATPTTIGGFIVFPPPRASGNSYNLSCPICVVTRNTGVQIN
jgi:hypothetical protein